MADVFRVHNGATNGSPVASTSYSTLDAEGADGAGPSLVQLLQETVREGARRGSRASSAKSRNGASKIDSHAPLPSLPSLSSPSSRAYISSLLSKDLPALLKEPDELSRQSDLLDGDLATLCYKSIGELLSVGECVDGVEDGFERMQGALDSLLSCTELLSSSCTEFTASIAPVISSRTRLNLVRNNIASIEDILSIPRLVSTCIRSGWWSEAVDLAFRAPELEDILKGQPVREQTVRSSRSLLGKVREDVEDELETLRCRIIEGLRARGLKLPSAVRSIALLRRLSTAAPRSDAEGVSTKTLTEPELRLTFLVSRWDCLRSQLEQLEMAAGSAANSEDQLRSIKRWIEVWREIVGETVTIYSEIFLTPDAPFAHPPSSTTKPARTIGEKPSFPLALNSAAAPLVVFLSQAQHALSRLLQHELPHITSTSSLVSVQTQLSYCAAAFSKFGFDFRHIIDRAIASRLLQITCERFDQVVETLRKDLSRAFTLSGARGGKPRLVISAMIATESWDSISALEESDLSATNTTKSSHPPAYIALFPPLAKLVNNYAMALNDLRLLPITNLYPTIVRALRSSLGETAAYMVQFVQAALESQEVYPKDERDSETIMQTMVLRKAGISFSKCIVPWITWALDEIVYPDIDKARWRDNDGSEGDMLSELGQLLHIDKAQPPQSLERATNDDGGTDTDVLTLAEGQPHVASPASAAEAGKLSDVGGDQIGQHLDGSGNSGISIPEATDPASDDHDGEKNTNDKEDADVSAGGHDI